ncbi:ASCH domain-containing protein [Mesorhizobium sp. M0976]|uniref:ASCH domain-containing protein n=1 Tax=Mesorhizobium sp. M0976 TaxID=2957038 RepID=UPI00333A1C1A
MIDLPDLALSVRQPWPWAILHGGKDIENRDWPTKIRGRVCLHASKGMTRDEYEDCLATVHHISVPDSASPWFFGRYGFVLRNAEPLDEFIPVKGALGFFKWRDQLSATPTANTPKQGSLL